MYKMQIICKYYNQGKISIIHIYIFIIPETNFPFGSASIIHLINLYKIIIR